MLNSIRSGTIAGGFSALAFAFIHHVFISDIWFSLPALLGAGAICGLCLGWTYGLLFEKPAIGSWLRYNALFVGMLALLGLVSLLVFEPVTTISELLVANGPPGELISQALPITVLFTLVMAAVLARLYGNTWTHYAAILLTCTVLVLLLGLNVSVIGLVFIPGSQVYLLAELFALILALNLVFIVAFAGLEWKSLLSNSS